MTSPILSIIIVLIHLLKTNIKYININELPQIQILSKFIRTKCKNYEYQITNITWVLHRLSDSNSNLLVIPFPLWPLIGWGVGDGTPPTTLPPYWKTRVYLTLSRVRFCFIITHVIGYNPAYIILHTNAAKIILSYRTIYQIFPSNTGGAEWHETSQWSCLKYSTSCTS